MSTQNKQSTANRPSDQRDVKAAEGRANTTGVQPGMPQHNEQGKPAGNVDDLATNTDPNPGPGITSQGHRVDEDTTTQDSGQDKDRERHNAEQDMPSKEQPRDQDKDRKDPMDQRAAEQAQQSKH